MVSENYPELKANQNFLTLQAQLEGTENRISVERGNFNKAVQRLQRGGAQFPDKFDCGHVWLCAEAILHRSTGAEKAADGDLTSAHPLPPPRSNGSTLENRDAGVILPARLGCRRRIVASTVAAHATRLLRRAEPRSLACAISLAGWSRSWTTVAPRKSFRRNPIATSTIMPALFQKKRPLRFNEQLAQFERETSDQVVVAVFPKMQSDSDIADYTQRVAQAWGVGQKGAPQRGRALCFHPGSQDVYPGRLRLGRRAYRTRPHSTSPNAPHQSAFSERAIMKVAWRRGST